jgi:hypothetical protein
MIIFLNIHTPCLDIFKLNPLDEKAAIYYLLMSLVKFKVLVYKLQ